MPLGCKKISAFFPSQIIVRMADAAALARVAAVLVTEVLLDRIDRRRQGRPAGRLPRHHGAEGAQAAGRRHVLRTTGL